MIEHVTRVTQLHVAPAGVPVFHESGFTVTIDDEASGEFIVLQTMQEDCKNGEVKITPEEWPTLREAIDRMVNNCQDQNA